MSTKEQIALPSHYQLFRHSLLEFLNQENNISFHSFPQKTGFNMSTKIKHLKEVMSQTTPGQRVKTWHIPETHSLRKLSSIKNKSPI